MRILIVQCAHIYVTVLFTEREKVCVCVRACVYVCVRVCMCADVRTCKCVGGRRETQTQTEGRQTHTHTEREGNRDLIVVSG